MAGALPHEGSGKALVLRPLLLNSLCLNLCQTAVVVCAGFWQAQLPPRCCMMLMLNRCTMLQPLAARLMRTAHSPISLY